MASTRPGGSGRGPLLWLMAVIAGLLAAGYSLWSNDSRRGVHGPEFSVTRTDERGAAAVYRLYQQNGLKPQVWDQELTQLKAPGLLILLAPARQRTVAGGIPVGQEGDLLPHEIRALHEWVRAGNVVALLTREDNPLFQAVGLIVDEPKGISGTPAVPAQPSLLARRVNGLQTQTQFGFKFGRRGGDANNPLTAAPPAPIEMIPTAQWLTLFVKREGSRAVPQVVSAAAGKGLYVAVNDVFPAGNVGIGMADNAAFMMNLARLKPAGGAIWFDEYHKRNPERGLVSYLRERSLAPALIYGVLLAALLFWRTGARFGAPEPLVADRRRDSGEYVRAVAALYQNAKMARQAFATIYSDFRRRLYGALRIDGMTDLNEVARRYEMRTGRPGVEARQILIEAEAALHNPELTDADAVHHCGRLTQLDRELHRRR